MCVAVRCICILFDNKSNNDNNNNNYNLNSQMVQYYCDFCNQALHGSNNAIVTGIKMIATLYRNRHKNDSNNVIVTGITI